MQATDTHSISGSILTPAGWVRGAAVVGGQRILRIEGTPFETGQAPAAPYVIPGFIDLHVHGGDGQDYLGSAAEIRRFLRFHAAHGTVAIAPTTATAPADVLTRSLGLIEAIRNDRQPGEPTVLGAHLEGPFINPDKLGAQMNVPLEGDVALALRWADTCKLVVATVAPEIPGGIAVMEALTARGCRVQIGHSLATASETAVAFARGMAGFTHLFNAMSGVDHRNPGVAAYALAHGRYAEMICDLNHVHPDVLLAAHRAIPRLYAITDATKFAGRPDGEYAMDHRTIIKRGLTITLGDGRTLAGSAITMIDAFRNLVSLGLSIEEASASCSTRQAEYLCLNDLGRIAPGALASVVVLDERLGLADVWVAGERIAG
jgi:N-acetylglucosamine-6-phosphate deacetylase